MRRFLLGGILAVLALAAVPAHAADPQCVLAGADMGEDGTVGMACTLTADANPHAFVSLTPNDWDIFYDKNGNGAEDPLDGDVIVFEFSPSGPDLPPVQQLPLEAGKNYTVRAYSGCAGACGHVGILIVR